MDATDVIDLLELEPLPGEGGWYRETYRAPDSRATAILYLVTDRSGSALHRLPSDEVWHRYAGDPVELLLLRPDGTGALVVLGPDLAAGQRPQAVVPAGTWQGAVVAPGGRWALLGTTMSPGFDPADWEPGDAAALAAGWPGFDRAIRLRGAAHDAG